MSIHISVSESIEFFSKLIIQSIRLLVVIDHYSNSTNHEEVTEYCDSIIVFNSLVEIRVLVIIMDDMKLKRNTLRH